MKTQALALSSPDNLSVYLQQINQIPLLTEEQEHDLAYRFRNEGDLEAAQQLVLSHLRFVARIARGYAGYGLAMADLIQEGTIGLMKAVKRFDPSQGVRLVSFAVHWIKSEMQEYIVRNWRMVKIATTKAQRKCFFNLRSKKQRLGWFTNEEVSEVAKDLNVPEHVVRQMEARLNASETSFDAMLDDDEDSTSPIHYLTSEALTPEEAMEAEEAKDVNERVVSAIERLDPRSQDIVQSRWLANEKSTLQNLADKYKVSVERVRQLEKSAMQKLHSWLEPAH